MIRRLNDFISRSECEYEYKLDVPASELTTFRIGGVVDALIIPKSKGALVALLRFMRDESIRHVVIGCGSNVLFDDEGYRGAVILTTAIDKMTIKDDIITAECGRTVTSAARAAQRAGLSGLQFAYGIPGTIGGAVAMNAGAYGGEIKDIIISAEVWSCASGELDIMTAEQLELSYRDSIIKREGLIVVSASFKCSFADPDEIEREMKDFMNRRRSKQPLEYPSAGSVFKRYPGFYTAKLIDDAGLKGLTVGGAAVSEKHAGFIINKGGASASEVKALVDIITEEIRKKNGIDIERELIYIPE